ncbi:MAG: hypothetical protein M3Q64_00560 [bacterium]|nr:hypothetical protein [bacterium]
MKRMNLLPKAQQQELHFEQLFHSILIAVVLATAILLLGVVVQLGVWAYLERSQAIMIKQIDVLKQATDKTENAELKKEIKLINAYMKDFTDLSARTPQWSRVLTALATQIPRGVQISKLDADLKTSKIDIAGYSPTRELVIELYNNINADKAHFRDIDYPLENVARPAEVQFHFTFYIKDGVLITTAK